MAMLSGQLVAYNAHEHCAIASPLQARQLNVEAVMMETVMVGLLHIIKGPRGLESVMAVDL